MLKIINEALSGLLGPLGVNWAGSVVWCEQLVVEKMLTAQGIKRTELGREAFVDKVWEWKETYGGKITNQMRRLGASCDWSRERFTLDEQLSGPNLIFSFAFAFFGSTNHWEPRILRIWGLKIQSLGASTFNGYSVTSLYSWVSCLVYVLSSFSTIMELSIGLLVLLCLNCRCGVGGFCSTAWERPYLSR